MVVQDHNLSPAVPLIYITGWVRRFCFINTKRANPWLTLAICITVQALKLPPVSCWLCAAPSSLYFSLIQTVQTLA